MTDILMNADRRLALAALGAVFAAPALATNISESRKDNSTHERDITQLVTDFCLAWNGRDVEKLIPFIAEDIEYHMWEGGPVVKGPAGFRQQLGGFMSSMKEIKWEVLRSQAIGDIVINERFDHFIRQPGAKRPDDHFHIAGVFLVRGGKIAYWKDYNMPKAG